MSANAILPIPMTSINSATFTGNYQAINAGGLPFSCFMIRIINNSNVDITVSYDGVVDHDYIQAVDDQDYPWQTNSQPNNYVALLRKGTIIYVKGAAGVGLVYLVGFYQPN